MSARDWVSFPCFTQEQVKEINKEINKINTIDEDPSSAASNVIKSGTFVEVHCDPLMKFIYPFIYQCQLSNRMHFGHDIFWQFHIEGLMYNVYGINDEYGWHIDKSDVGEYDMKLTCLLNLSEEPYEGGELFLINDQKNPTEFSSGMGLVFNSMIAHKVTPVTKGKRISLTYWAIGPNWK